MDSSEGGESPHPTLSLGFVPHLPPPRPLLGLPPPPGLSCPSCPPGSLSSFDQSLSVTSSRALCYPPPLDGQVWGRPLPPTSLRNVRWVSCVSGSAPSSPSPRHVSPCVTCVGTPGTSSAPGRPAGAHRFPGRWTHGAGAEAWLVDMGNLAGAFSINLNLLGWSLPENIRGRRGPVERVWRG